MPTTKNMRKKIYLFSLQIGPLLTAVAASYQGEVGRELSVSEVVL